MPMGGAELLILLAILLLFFGAKRIPQLARSLGTGARELKKATSEDTDESEMKEAASKDADEGKAKATSEDAPSDKVGTEWSGSPGPNSRTRLPTIKPSGK
jgi:sec-independent protein translocase protein TatA